MSALMSLISADLNHFDGEKDDTPETRCAVRRLCAMIEAVQRCEINERARAQ
jgi:hypothetical protein